MGKLESIGNFVVSVETATVKANPKEADEQKGIPADPGAFQIGLKGVTPDGLEAWGYLFFFHKTYESGKNIGRSFYDVSIELLKALGVEDGHPANLQTAIDAGMEVEFHMAMDEYNGVSAVKVKYINPVRNQIDVKDANWAEIIAKYEAKDATEETKKPEPTVAPPKTKEDGTVEKKDEAEKTEADFINSEKKDDGALEVDKIPF